MLTSYLSNLITRQLRALSREIQSFPDDDALWRTPPGVTNSTGTLVLSSWRIGPQYNGARAYTVNHILRSDSPGSSQLDNTRRLPSTA